MRKFVRTEPPAICATHSEKWNNQWVLLKRENPKARFVWYVADGHSAREYFLPNLRDQTNGHCSFCDAYPVAGVSNETIEHFRPKGMFPEMAFTWSNLFYCCNACQDAKHEDWDEMLIRPDEVDYSFTRYFEYDFTTGEIKPNHKASEADQMRAEVTRRIYGLDSDARRRNRLNEARQFTRCKHVDDNFTAWAYRDFLGVE